MVGFNVTFNNLSVLTRYLDFAESSVYLSAATYQHHAKQMSQYSARSHYLDTWVNQSLLNKLECQGKSR